MDNGGHFSRRLQEPAALELFRASKLHSIPELCWKRHSDLSHKQDMMNKAQSYPHPSIDELLALLQEDIFSDAPECSEKWTAFLEPTAQAVAGF